MALVKSIEETEELGKVIRISGSVVFASGLKNIAKNNIVLIGKDKIIGEIVKIDHSLAIIQTYEDTIGLQIGAKVINTGKPLYANLGPGLLGSVVDGLQRPLDELRERTGPFLTRGASKEPTIKDFYFYPLIKIGENINAGSKIGYIMEKSFKHYILAPPTFKEDIVTFTAPEGIHSSDDSLI